MYKCAECGLVFDPDEEGFYEWDEPNGCDTPPYEHFIGCPACHGDCCEAKECEMCGEWFIDDELEDGLCEKCLNERDLTN